MTGGRGLGLDFFEKIADIEARFHFVSGLCGKVVRGQFCPEANFVQRVAPRLWAAQSTVWMQISMNKGHNLVYVYLHYGKEVEVEAILPTS